MYNNPNFYGYQPFYYSGLPQKTGIFSKLKGGIDWGGFLTNTSKTLNVINQAIPLFYQIRPLIQNAKTMFKIADIIKTDDKPIKQKRTNNEVPNFSNNHEIKDKNNVSQPTFFL